MGTVTLHRTTRMLSQRLKRAVCALAEDETGAVSTEYLLAMGLLFLVTSVALATLASTLFGHYAAAPMLLQTGSP